MTRRNEFGNLIMSDGEIAGRLWELGYTSEDYWEIIENFGYTETEAIIICNCIERF